MNDKKVGQGRKVLITGGAGFIGSGLCEGFLQEGFKVTCLDNLSTGKKENIEGLLKNPDFTFVEGDITDFETCMKACEGVEFVLNEAACSSVPVSIAHPSEFCKNNILGTQNMLEAARQQGVKRFIYASSASVYGDAEGGIMVEGREGNLLSPYALTKRANEEWAKQYGMHYGLFTVGLRYFNVYGYRQDPKGAYSAVIPLFIEKMLHDQTPTIFGDGNQSRDFVFIEDVVQANLLACTAEGDCAGEVFNVAAGSNLTVNEMYESLAAETGFGEKPIYAEKREGDILHSGASIEKIRERLGFEPKWAFADGIRKTVEWYRGR